MERTPDQNNPEENTRGERSKKNEALPPLPTAISGGKSYRSDTYKYPGGGRTILGSFQRVKIEGRRGRGYWEWKAAELKKRASAEEADDELTSFESDSLKKISTSPPKSHVTFQQDLNFQNKERPNASFITDGNSRLTASSERVPVSGGVRVLPPYLPYQDIAGYTQKGVSASSDQPPSNEEEKSPVERITISSFSQPRLTPLLNRAQPPREPPSPSPSPPSGNSPTAPPKELVYADAESRRAARSQPALGQDHQSQGSSEPSKYSGVKQITYSKPQLISRGHNETSELKGSVSNERKNFNEEIRQYYHDDKLEGGQKSSDKSANEYYVPGTKISTSTYTGHSESSLNTSRHDNTLSSIPSLNSSKNYNDFEPETKPLLLQGSDDDLVKEKATKSPPAASGAARLDRASSLVPLSKLKPSEATCSQKNQSSERKSGALVWVSQPGGGAKLEWVPTPGLSTLRAVPASPQGSLRGNPSSHSQQPSRGTSNDVAGVAASKTQDATPKGIIKRGDEGGGGGGRRYGGYDEDARGGGSYMARVASDDPRAVRDGNVSHTGNSSRPSNCTGGYSSEDSSSDAFVAVPGAEAPVFNSSSSPSVKSKNVRSSAPGITRSAGRTYSPLAGNRALISQGSDKAIDSSNKAEEDKVVTVAGRTQGQTVRIRIRPEVHAYLSTLPVIRGCLGVQQPTGPVTTERRDSIHSANSSSASGLTLGSGEGSSGYQEQDYEAVIDEYTLLKKAVDEHDPEALRLLTATEAALYPEGGGGGSEYPYLREMKERLLIAKEDPVMGISDQDNQLLEVHQTPVSTVVRLNADGYGSHTSPTHRVESLYTGTLESRRTHAHEFFPKNAKTSTFITLSLLYATLLIVVCLGFVLSEVLTHNVPLYYYEAFFTYLYGLSIFFLLYVFCYLLTDSSGEIKTPNTQKVRKTETLPSEAGGSPTQEKLTGSTPKPKKHKTTDNDHSHGSFFLRIGAIAFGLGTMIYNGLEFGVFFEIPMNSPCHQILRGVNPLLQLVFTFMQMYFIFMNARLNIHKFKFIARFGLMHIVATNLCVWIRTLVRESLKEINEFRVTQGHKGEDYMILEGIRRALENRGLMAPNRYMYNLDAFQVQDENATAIRGNWVSEEDLVNRTCERMEIMGSIVSDSAPYLYPFIVEYSLIGAAVLYIMWKHIGRNPKFVYDAETADGLSVVSRRCHSKVDCVGASKGLFCGLLVLVATLICLILFFVLIHQEELRMLAIYLADVSHCGIMLLSIVAIFIGFCRVRHLKFFGEREEELDDILLMVSAFGLFAYAVFSAVAGSLSAFTEEPNLLVMITGILSVIQVMIQMVFVKDSQRRQVALPEQERTKPGRQIVTFLLICNLAMWVIYTFETQKVEANPVQLEFFGKLSWTILLRCTLPLAIFHRFHSSVVLAAIWKNSYKTRLE